MQLLDSNIQHYHWGDYKFIPELQGRASEKTPEAELWMGAHPKSPSRTLGSDQALDELITLNPMETLGEHAKDFNEELPYIMKILAIRSPLSLQVHPTEEQAKEGFENETTLEKENRSYFSPRGKEEIVCAITDTDIKFGFRESKEISEIFGLATKAEFQHFQEVLSVEDTQKALKDIVGRILKYQPDQVHSFIEDILATAKNTTFLSDREMSYFADLVEIYPTDPGMIIFLMMNFLTLQPGESLYVPPTITHAYLYGNAIEITSNSDNVLRCGLSPKQLDHNEYLKVGTFTPSNPDVQKPEGNIHTYTSPTQFSLSRLDIENEWNTILNGPEILLSTEGAFTIVNAFGQSLRVEQGTPVWIPYSDTHYHISGTCLIFRCATQIVN